MGLRKGNVSTELSYRTALFRFRATTGSHTIYKSSRAILREEPTSVESFAFSLLLVVVPRWKSKLSSIGFLWGFAILRRLTDGSCTIAAGAFEVQKGTGQTPPWPELRHQELYSSWSHQPSCPQLPTGTHDADSSSGSGSDSGSTSGCGSGCIGAAVGRGVGGAVEGVAPVQPLDVHVASALQ